MERNCEKLRVVVIQRRFFNEKYLKNQEVFNAKYLLDSINKGSMDYDKHLV